jgi:uncharacterized protein (TIGR02265 family)
MAMAVTASAAEFRGRVGAARPGMLASTSSSPGSARNRLSWRVMAQPAGAALYRDPPWNAPIKVQDYIANAPPLPAKGMFLTCITRLAKERSGKDVGRPHYTAFKDYTSKEWLELLPECAKLAFPNLPLRSALFEIGAHVYTTFAESTIGSVVMSVAGRDVHAALKLVTRAYDSVGAGGRVKLVELEERRAVVQMRDVWDYPDCYQPGVLSAGVRAYGETPRVRICEHKKCDVDIELTW